MKIKLGHPKSSKLQKRIRDAVKKNIENVSKVGQQAQWIYYYWDIAPDYHVLS